MKRLLGLCTAVLVLAAASPAAADLVVGTPHGDNLHGTPDDDVIRGKGGADSLRAGHGDDNVYGGPGRDFITDGGDDDAVYGGGEQRHLQHPARRRPRLRRDRARLRAAVPRRQCRHGRLRGRGKHDFVQYTGNLESHDEFKGCERVEEYTP